METILAGETGWLVPPADADALARALAEALDLAPEAIGWLLPGARWRMCAGEFHRRRQ